MGHLQEGEIFMIAFVGTLPEFTRTRRQMFIEREKDLPSGTACRHRTASQIFDTKL